MLADPQSITISGVATSFALVKDEDTQRTYQTADGAKQLITKQNATAQRFRREVRIVSNDVLTDPVSGLSTLGSASVYLVIDEPKVGYTDSNLEALIDGLKSFLTTTIQGRVLAGEM